MSLLQAVEVKSGILSHISLYHLCGEEAAVVGGMVAEEQFYFSTVFHDDQHPAVHHQVNVRPQYVYHLYRPVHHSALRHVYQQAVLRQHGVQRRDAVLLRLRYLGVVSAYQFRLLGGDSCQRVHNHSLWQFLLGQCLVVETVVHHEV